MLSDTMQYWERHMNRTGSKGMSFHSLKSCSRAWIPQLTSCWPEMCQPYTETDVHWLSNYSCDFPSDYLSIFPQIICFTSTQLFLMFFPINMLGGSMGNQRLHFRESWLIVFPTYSEVALGNQRLHFRETLMSVGLVHKTYAYILSVAKIGSNAQRDICKQNVPGQKREVRKNKTET